MESLRVRPDRPSALGRHLSLAAVREHGVSAEQLPMIGTDPEIFDAFYAEHLEDLQRFVARRVGDPERAADLTADIFLAAIGAAHRFRPGATPKTWLYGIAVVVVAEDRRRGARERAREKRIRGSALHEEEETARIEGRIDAAARARGIYEAMDRLGEDERAILELVAIDELTVAEAAAAVGVRPVTARVRLHRARRKLRADLAAAAVVAVAALALVFGASRDDTPAAFAVQTRPEGKVSVEVRSLDDPGGLEAALGEAGISASVSYLASGMTCEEPRFRAASAKNARALVAGPGSLIDPSLDGEGPLTFTIDRGEVGPGRTLVITAWPRPGALLGGAELTVAEGPVAPCEQVPAL